ncbi:GtrA family protein [Patescibacteria group bacterium]
MMLTPKTKDTLKQLVRFGLVGIMNTFVDLLILNIETIATGIKEGAGYSVQKGISFLAAVIFSYFLNKHWTFQDKSKEEAGKKFSQFAFVSAIGMLINISTATLVITYAKAPVNELLQLSFLTDQLWVNIGALSGTAIGLIWNFIGYKLWVFKK